MGEQGDPFAQYRLGDMYERGVGVPQSFVEARSWHRKAAEQGHIEAAYRLGYLYYVKGSDFTVYSETRTEDLNEAIDWFRKAAEQGHADAQYRLGYLHDWKGGVYKPFDYSVYGKGRGRISPSIYRLYTGWFYDEFPDLDKDDPRRGVIRYTRRYINNPFIYWYREAAKQDHADAQYELANTIYDNHKNFPNSHVFYEVMNWYRKAAEQNHPGAKYKLGQMFERGEGTPQDFVEAVCWYEQAADQGHVEAMHDLGLIHERGEKGVPQDFGKAAFWYEQAAEQAYAPAQEKLAEMNYKGKGISRNFDRAFSLYRESWGWSNVHGTNV